jgi:hypothetical protein
MFVALSKLGEFTPMIFLLSLTVRRDPDDIFDILGKGPLIWSFCPRENNEVDKMNWKDRGTSNEQKE